MSDKMDKTIAVLVSTIKVDAKYGKRYRRDKRFLVHDSFNKHKTGDKVSFAACKPYSKKKRWKVID